MSSSRPLVVLCAFAGAALLAVSNGRHGWDAYKAWRAHRLLADSHKHATENSMAVALQTAHAAYLLDSSDVEIARNIATLATRVALPQATDFWRQELALPGSTNADFSSAVEAATQRRQFADARTWIESWRALPGADAVLIDCAEARLSAATGNVAATKDRLAAVRRESGGTLPPEMAILEAETLLTTGSKTDLAHAGAELLEAGNAPTDTGARALLVCLVLDAFPTDTRQSAATRLLHHPNAQPAQRIIARLVVGAHDATTDSEIVTEASNVLDRKPGPITAQVLTALVKAGRGDLLLRCLSSGKARADKALYPFYLEALLQTKDFNGVLDATADAKSDAMSPAVSLVYRARAQIGNGDKDGAKESVRTAIGVATDDDLPIVERAVRASGDAKLTFDYYSGLTGNPRVGALAQAAALSAAYDLHDSTAIENLLPKIDLNASRLSADLHRRAIYLMLLDRERTDEATRAAEDLFARSGGAEPARLLLAFANVRNGHSDTARELVKDINPATLRDAADVVMLASVEGTRPENRTDATTLLPRERTLLARLSTAPSA